MGDGTSHYRESRWMFNKIWFKFPERVSLKTLVLRTPCFGSSYPQVVRVPPVKNHWFIWNRSWWQHKESTLKKDRMQPATFKSLVRSYCSNLLDRLRERFDDEMSRLRQQSFCFMKTPKVSHALAMFVCYAISFDSRLKLVTGCGKVTSDVRLWSKLELPRAEPYALPWQVEAVACFAHSQWFTYNFAGTRY